jgi:hypothetical protein
MFSDALDNPVIYDAQSMFVRLLVSLWREGWYRKVIYLDHCYYVHDRCVQEHTRFGRKGHMFHRTSQKIGFVSKLTNDKAKELLSSFGDFL